MPPKSRSLSVLHTGMLSFIVIDVGSVSSSTLASARFNNVALCVKLAILIVV